MWLQEKNPALRRQKLFSLGRNSLKEFKLSLANDPSPVIRHEAAFLLGESKNKKVVSILMQAIKDDESDLVRHEAIEALGDLKVKTRQVENLLRSLLKDKNPFIRDTADIALLTLEL